MTPVEPHRTLRDPQLSTDSDVAMIFPPTWRYVPLRWSSGMNGGSGGWYNALAYRSDRRLGNLRESRFYGFDVGGTAYFGNGTLDGFLEDEYGIDGGIPGVARTNGMAVGIFVRACRPRLVVIDCDSGITVDEKNGSVARMMYGRDQLLALARRHGQRLPRVPTVRGNREHHGYLIFKQNESYPVRSRKIKPYGLQLDVVGNGHQLHWSAQNRELLVGAELLDNPPELPAWLAMLLSRSRDPTTEELKKLRCGGSIANVDLDSDLGKMFLEAALRPVTPGRGSWNQRLFNAACLLAEAGVDRDVIIELVLNRAVPETPQDQRSAMSSIESAWRRVTGEAARD